MNDSSDLALVLRLVDASHTLADQWRRNAARESVGGQEALTRWQDLAARSRAMAGAAADHNVRVAVMGRVKAGKSTLLNALFGRTVAATHAFEQSSAIHQIKAVGPGEAEWGRINRQGVVEQLGPEELAARCAQHRGDAAFWEQVEDLDTRVRSDVPPGLAFFDTPGVGSLGAKNVNRTNEFLDGAHIVLWVQSGQGLGNAEDRRFLDELIRRGRPILPVMTRADLLDDDDKADAVGWFRRTFPTLPEPLLADAPRWSSSSPERQGLLDLLVSQASVRRGPGVGIERLKLDIEAAADAEQVDISRLGTVFGHVDRVVELMKVRVRGAVEDAVAEQVEHLFEAEWSAISADIQDQVRSRSAASGLVAEAFQRHLGDDRIQAVLEGIQSATRARLEHAWGQALAQALDDLGTELAGILKGAEVQKLERMSTTLATVSLQHQQQNTVAKVVVGGAALAGAGYAAWFAANAAAVSIGTALATVAVPVALAGLLGVGLKGLFWDPRAARKEANEEATRVMAEVRAMIRTDIIQGKFLPAVRADIEKVGDGVAALLIREIAGGVERNELRRAEAFFGHLARQQYDAALRLALPLPALEVEG